LRSILLAGIVTLLLGFALDKPATAALAANETPTSDPEDTLSNVLGYFQADVPPATDGVLPDLQNLPPADLRLVYSLGKKYLRFSISIWNAGLGILELVGQPNISNDEIEVNQRLYDDEGAKVDELPVGNLVYHPFHFHLHLGEFAHYEIWSVRTDFTPNTVVADGKKVSYCVCDINRIDRDEPG
jgi:hypothetical protein